MKAFPSIEPIHGNDVIGIKQSYGMELRDYFAAKAMQGLLTTVKGEEWQAEETAEISYQVADAMMVAREIK